MPKTYALVKDGRVLDVKEWPDTFDDHDNEISTETRKALIKGNEEEGLPPIDRGIHDTPPIHECFHPDLGDWIELSGKKESHPAAGWLYEDDQFKPPQIEAFAPPSLSKRQILLWLLDHDKSDEDVLVALDKMRGKEKSKAKINWMYPDSRGFMKDDPIFSRIAEEFSVDVDKLFSEAVVM